jgi:hypothetical protein
MWKLKKTFYFNYLQNLIKRIKGQTHKKVDKLKVKQSFCALCVEFQLAERINV